MNITFPQNLNLSINWEKHVFYWENWNFEPIGKSAQTIEFLALGCTLFLILPLVFADASKNKQKLGYC